MGGRIIYILLQYLFITLSWVSFHWRILIFIDSIFVNCLIAKSYSVLVYKNYFMHLFLFLLLTCSNYGFEISLFHFSYREDHSQNSNWFAIYHKYRSDNLIWLVTTESTQFMACYHMKYPKMLLYSFHPMWTMVYWC